MASLAKDMVLKSLEAFVKVNAELAETICPADNEVDALRDKVYTELVDFMQRDPASVPAAVDLIFVARNLERIADHATNIAEDVIFLAKGVDFRRAVGPARSA